MIPQKKTVKLTNARVKELRKDFPLLQTRVQKKSLVYLDSAATTQKPKVVISALKKYYETANANVHRGVYVLSEKATALYEEAHAVVAAFINAKREEIIFTRNTTEGINLLAYTLPSLVNNPERKEIVLTEMEHHANLVPWQQCAKRNGYTLSFIKMKPDFTLDYEDAKQKIGKHTAIVSLVHVSNALGTINDVQKICALAQANGAYSIVDAAQSAAHIPLDVQTMGCDFLVFSGHKMLGPTGIGVLYGRSQLLERLPPFLTGGDMIREVTYTDATWNDLPMKFEAGTPHIAGAVGLMHAVEYLQSIGMNAIHMWEQELLTYALQKMKKIKGVGYYLPPKEQSTGILSFNLIGIHAHDAASILSEDGVCIRGGHHCAMPLMTKLGIVATSRASFYVYTTYEDIDRFILALTKAQGIFK